MHIMIGTIGIVSRKETKSGIMNRLREEFQIVQTTKIPEISILRNRLYLLGNCIVIPTPTCISELNM